MCYADRSLSSREIDISSENQKNAVPQLCFHHGGAPNLRNKARSQVSFQLVTKKMMTGICVGFYVYKALLWALYYSLNILFLNQELCFCSTLET